MNVGEERREERLEELREHRGAIFADVQLRRGVAKWVEVISGLRGRRAA